MAPGATPDPDGEWRDYLDYESPHKLVAAFPWFAEPEWASTSYCSACGKGTPRPPSELWVVKHRHSNQPLGNLRFYCRDHLPSREWTEGESGLSVRQVEVVCPVTRMTIPAARAADCDWCGGDHSELVDG